MPLHTPACHVATPSALPIQFTTPTPMYGQNPFRRRLHTSSCRCPPSLCSVPAHTCLHRLSSVVRCMSRLSHPVTLSLRVRAYKRSPPHPLQFICVSASCPPPVSRVALICFHHCRSLWADPLAASLSPLADPGASLSFGATSRLGEPTPSSSVSSCASTVMVSRHPTVVPRF
jgi:hypothetical protein